MTAAPIAPAMSTAKVLEKLFAAAMASTGAKTRASNISAGMARTTGKISHSNPSPFPLASASRTMRSDDRHAGKDAEQLDQATSPSGFSTSALNAFINFAPSAPSMARWSKLPVALMTVAICRLSSMT